MKISSLTQPPSYQRLRAPRFGEDDAPQPPVRRPLALGLTVLGDAPPHDHQADGPSVKPCCAGKKKADPLGLSLTVINNPPDTSGEQAGNGDSLTVLTPPTHKPGGSCCGGHKPQGDTSGHQQPVTTSSGGSCCGTKPGNHNMHGPATLAKPTTLSGKVLHALMSIVVWFGHFLGSFWADMKLLVSGKTS